MQSPEQDRLAALLTEHSAREHTPRTRAALRREAAEGRLRVLLRGQSALYSSVARAVRYRHMAVRQ